jgi:hypothetical protein
MTLELRLRLINSYQRISLLIMPLNVLNDGVCKELQIKTSLTTKQSIAAIVCLKYSLQKKKFYKFFQ